MSVLMNPDCLDGKHRACSGVGWDDFPVDEPADCPCECHGGPMGVEHFPGCPCGWCQKIRAARPNPPVPLAYLPCCGATVKLRRTPTGYAGTETHHTHCPDTGATFLPETKETT